MHEFFNIFINNLSYTPFYWLIKSLCLHFIRTTKGNTLWKEKNIYQITKYTIMLSIARTNDFRFIFHVEMEEWFLFISIAILTFFIKIKNTLILFYLLLMTNQIYCQLQNGMYYSFALSPEQYQNDLYPNNDYFFLQLFQNQNSLNLKLLENQQLLQTQLQALKQAPK